LLDSALSGDEVNRRKKHPGTAVRDLDAALKNSDEVNRRKKHPGTHTIFERLSEPVARKEQFQL
jgi:hypothetical protein